MAPSHTSCSILLIWESIISISDFTSSFVLSTSIVICVSVRVLISSGNKRDWFWPYVLTSFSVCVPLQQRVAWSWSPVYVSLFSWITGALWAMWVMWATFMLTGCYCGFENDSCIRDLSIALRPSLPSLRVSTDVVYFKLKLSRSAGACGPFNRNWSSRVATICRSGLSLRYGEWNFDVLIILIFWLRAVSVPEDPPCPTCYCPSARRCFLINSKATCPSLSLKPWPRPGAPRATLPTTWLELLCPNLAWWSNVYLRRRVSS